MDHSRGGHGAWRRGGMRTWLAWAGAERREAGVDAIAPEHRGRCGADTRAATLLTECHESQTMQRGAAHYMHSQINGSRWVAGPRALG